MTLGGIYFFRSMFLHNDWIWTSACVTSNQRHTPAIHCLYFLTTTIDDKTAQTVWKDNALVLVMSTIHEASDIGKNTVERIEKGLLWYGRA